MSPLLAAPLVVVGPRDAPWLRDALRLLVRTGYFDTAPFLLERAESLVADCHIVANHCQTEALAEPAPDTELVDFATATALLGISERTLYRRVRAGVFEPVRVNGSVRFRRRDLVEHLEET